MHIAYELLKEIRIPPFKVSLKLRKLSLISCNLRSKTWCKLSFWHFKHDCYLNHWFGCETLQNMGCLEICLCGIKQNLLLTDIRLF